MNAFRSAQRSFDAESPPEPAHDYTEDMDAMTYAKWLVLFMDFNDFHRDAARDWICQRMAAQDKGMRE